MFYGSFKRSLKYTFDGIQNFTDQISLSPCNSHGMNSSRYIQSALYTSIYHDLSVGLLIRFWPCIMILTIWTIRYERCPVSSQFSKIFAFCIFCLLLINLKYHMSIWMNEMDNLITDPNFKYLHYSLAPIRIF